MTSRSMPDATVTAIIETFSRQIAAAVEATGAALAQSTLAGAFGGSPKSGSGRPSRKVVTDLGVAGVAKDKKSSPKVARVRKLQGQYMGALRSLKGAARAKVKQIAKDKGVAEAVRVARSLRKT